MMKASVTAYALQGVAGWYVCSPWAAFIPLGDAKMWRIPQKKKKKKRGIPFRKPNIHQRRWVVLLSPWGQQPDSCRGKRCCELQGQGSSCASCAPVPSEAPDCFCLVFSSHLSYLFGLILTSYARAQGEIIEFPHWGRGIPCGPP